MTEVNYKEETLFVCTNEDGAVTANVDRDTAIERMGDDYGGQTLRVLKLTVRIPVHRDDEATLTLPVDVGERVQIEVRS